MVARGEIFWADLGPPAGRRPVCVITRDSAGAVLSAVVCAPITRTVRGIASEVEVASDHGLPSAGVINCDNLLTVPKVSLDPESVGSLGAGERMQLDRALRFALGIVH